MDATTVGKNPGRAPAPGARPRPGARAGVGCRARLRDTAHASVLDHPVASLRLHDDQRGAARLRRRGQLRHRVPPPARRTLRERVRGERGAVRHHGDRLLPARPARAVQRPRVPVGSAPAVVARADLPAALRAILLRGPVRVPGVHTLRRARGAGLQLRHPRRGRGVPGYRAAAVCGRAGARAGMHRRVRVAGRRADAAGGTAASPGCCADAPRHGAAAAVAYVGCGGGVAHVALQGAQPDARGDGRTRARAALGSTGAGHGGGEPASAVAPCSRAQPELPGRAARAAGAVHRRRGHERDPALRRQS